LRGLAPPTIRQPGLTRVVRQCQGPTGPRQLAKHTTQGRGRPAPHINPPMPMGITEPLKFPRTARLRIHNMKLLRRDPSERIKAAMEPGGQQRQAHTAMLRWARPRAAPSTPRKTGMSTKTAEADGSKPREPQGPDPVIRAPRGKAIPLPPEVGERRGRAVEDPLPTAGMGGNRDRKALEVRIAAVEEEVGAADADKWP